MDITINGKATDITLENEKNLGEVIANLEQWLVSLGHRLSAISIDGETVQLSLVEEIFSRDVNGVKSLDLKTSSIAQLSAESLLTILADIKDYESLENQDKKNYLAVWKQTPQANYTSENMSDLYNVLTNAFAGVGLSTQDIFSITEERLREVKDPQKEFKNLKPLLDETCSRLTELSLDVQTGKDTRAAQTIQLFSGVTEKMLRTINQLDVQGYLSKNEGAEKPFTQIIDELGKLVKELYDAYERHDTVLVGDIAEYEAADKLQELYAACLTETVDQSIKSEK